jgi:hypothetical protein
VVSQGHSKQVFLDGLISIPVNWRCHGPGIDVRPVLKGVNRNHIRLASAPVKTIAANMLREDLASTKRLSVLLCDRTGQGSYTYSAACVPRKLHTNVGTIA